MERLLVTYDWGEAFVALNLVLKPVIDELFLKQASDLALTEDDHLLGQIFYSLNEDCQRRRQWSQALVHTATQDTATNSEVIQAWSDKWYPGALPAVDALVPLFKGSGGAAGSRPLLNLTSRIGDFCADCLRAMQLQPGNN